MQADWLNNGYVIVRGAFDVSAAARELKSLLPPAESDAVHDFGNGGIAEFPCAPELDKMTVHPKLLWMVRQCLGSERITLTQSVAWAKYGRTEHSSDSNNDQRVHMDYGNHYWGFPPKQPNMLAAIIYYSDTVMTGGATAIVPKRSGFDFAYAKPFAHMPGIGGLPFINNKGAAEAMMAEKAPESAAVRAECYARESTPDFKSGDVLLYRMDTWHRGTPVKDGKVRYAHNLAWKIGDVDGIQTWNGGFTRAMYTGTFERFISSLEPHQLETLGFPARNSVLWESEEYCRSIRHRYEWAGFDLHKYIQWSPEPPPVPEFWVFSKDGLDGDQHPTEFRTSLFSTLKSLGVCISVVDSKWHWELEYCEGPHYICADLFIFMSEGKVIADLNRLQGERYTWWNLVRNIKHESGRVLYDYSPIEQTPTSMITLLQRKEIHLIGSDVLRLVATDQSPEIVLPFLKHPEPNVVRTAMYRLTFFDRQPNDCSDIKKWLNKPLHGFMEREIAKHATTIMQKRSRL